ncbi:serpin-ZX [Citrus sinensis]|uniref:Serpin-ZX n=1 Tax=Citrus sinensis TaxID=2711 RepID=A0ACB8NW70_CITSI|nr:serpin-ZX [Citrus sinensis]
MDVRESISNQTDVGLSLTKHVALTEAKDSNLFLPPSSTRELLSLITAGSKGPTLDQLLSFLKSKSDDQLNTFAAELVAVVFADGSPSGGSRLSAANGVRIDQSLSLGNTFKQIVDNIYKAASNQVDFQTKAAEVYREVNMWAEKETNGLIKEVLPPGSVDISTKLIFANELKKRQFVSALMVSKFYGFLPNKVRISAISPCTFSLLDGKDGLPILVEKMGSESRFLDRHLPSQKVEVGEFMIPKFKVSCGIEVSNALEGLGLELPFFGEGNLYISSIFQKSLIEVNEGGTKPVATSVVRVALMCMPLYDKIYFVANHPFVFIIREDMIGLVMFIGHVLNPLAG